MVLSQTQHYNIKNTIFDTIDKINNTIDKELSQTKKHFLSKITNNYNQKSYKQFTYFLKNISNGFNKRTGKPICNNLYDKYNNYKYTKNIYLDDNETIKLQELIKGSYLNKKHYTYASKKVAKALYIEHHSKDKNRVFITFTLPTEWHYYTKKGKKKNKHCKYDNYEISIKKSIEQLNIINRNLHQTMNIELKRYYKKLGKKYEPYAYLKILEYHKSLTGHSHKILYVNDEQLPVVKKVYKSIKKKYGLKKTDYQVLTDTKGSNYVYKYLLKGLNEENENSIFNKYKSYFNNVRVFSSSNFKHTTQAQLDKVYAYISKERPLLMKYLKRIDKPLYVSLEEIIQKGYFKFEYKENHQTVVDKKLLQKYIETNYKSNSKKFKLLKTALKDKNEFVKTIKQKIISKVYFRKRSGNSSQLIYDKEDFISCKKKDFKKEFFGDYIKEPEPPN